MSPQPVRRRTRPSWLDDVSTFQHTDSTGITLAVSARHPDDTVTVAVEGRDGMVGVWVDDVPADLLRAALAAPVAPVSGTQGAGTVPVAPIPEPERESVEVGA